MDELAQILQRYIGGQFEVAELQDAYLGRGTIKSIQLLDGREPTALVDLSWIAFYDRQAKEWHLDDRTSYMVPLASFTLFAGNRLFVKNGNEGRCFALPGDVMLASSDIVDLKPSA